MFLLIKAIVKFAGKSNRCYPCYETMPKPRLDPKPVYAIFLKSIQNQPANTSPRSQDSKSIPLMKGEHRRPEKHVDRAA